jgi:hypothetical protein
LRKAEGGRGKRGFTEWGRVRAGEAGNASSSRQKGEADPGEKEGRK